MSKFFSVLMFVGLVILMGCSTPAPSSSTTPTPTASLVPSQSPLVTLAMQTTGAKSTDDLLVNPYGFHQWFPMTDLMSHRVPGHPQTFEGYLDYVLGERPNTDPHPGRLMTSFRSKTGGATLNVVLSKETGNWSPVKELLPDEEILATLRNLRTKFVDQKFTPTASPGTTYNIRQLDTQLGQEAKDVSEESAAKSILYYMETFADKTVRGYLSLDLFGQGAGTEFTITKTPTGYHFTTP